MVNLTVDKADVRMVVKRCEACESIDSAPVQWKKGQLGASNAWQRVGMDITHYGGNHFLTLIDCGPTRFVVWKLIVRQDSSSVIRQLSSIFFERGAPEEILADNDPAFRSNSSCRKREAAMHIHTIEQRHRSIKKIAARKQCTISVVSYWYNIIPMTVCPRQLHLQMPFTGTEFEKRGSMLYKYLTTRKCTDHTLWVISSE